MINSNTSFGKLKEVVVGRELCLSKRISDVTFKHFYRHALDEAIYQKPFDDYHVSLALIDQRNIELDNLAATLSSQGIIVHRPDVLNKIVPFTTPSFKSELSSASNVRDVSLVYRDKIIETPTFVRNRYYENTLLYNVYNNAWDSGRGGQWIRCPHTEITEETIDLNLWTDPRDYTNIDKRFTMAIDGAQFLRIGKDVIVNVSSYNHWKGYEWVKSFFPESNFHPIHCVDNHIDGALICLRPGVFLLNPAYPELYNSLPDKFKKWKFLIPEDLPENIDVTGMTNIDLRLASSRGMDVNILSIDENTVVVNKRAHGVKNVLEKHGFDIIEVQLDHGEIFAGGIHCSTLDLVREDEFISY
jgi:glycine amidinotransferase